MHAEIFISQKNNLIGYNGLPHQKLKITSLKESASIPEYANNKHYLKEITLRSVA